MEKHSGNRNEHRTPRPVIWPMILLLVLNLLIASYMGCQSARDSGSTVTGRSLSYPSFGGVPFMRVLLDGKETDRFQVTDAGGSFSMSHVPLGSYKVRYAVFGLSVYTQDLVINQNDEVYMADVPGINVGTAPLSGTVKDDTGNINNADIWLIFHGKGMARTQTDPKGEFKFTNLPDGVASIVATSEGRKMKVVDSVKIGFEGVDKVDITMVATEQVETGTVTGTIKDETGVVINNAYVGALPGGIVLSIYSIAQRELFSSSKGYTMNLPPGIYKIVCTKSGYVPKTKLVTVTPGSNEKIDFTLMSEEAAWIQSMLQKDGSSITH
jgi:hypothetical protein